MARSGRLRGMSDAQLTQGAGVYLMELDKLAKAPGMTPKRQRRLGYNSKAMPE